MLLTPAALRLLATLLIVAQQPDGSVLVTADSRVGQLHFRSGSPQPTTYRDDGCKIALVNHVVFLYAGEPRHTADIGTSPGHTRTVSWDAMQLASTLIRRHHGSLRTQQELDSLALRWAQSVESSERALTRQLTEAGNVQPTGGHAPATPATPFQPSTGIFLTSSPGGPVLQSIISIRQQKVGMLIERGSATGDDSAQAAPTARSSASVPTTRLAFYGDEQAQSTAAQAFARIEAIGPVTAYTFAQLEQVNETVANKIANVAPPFDQALLLPGASPIWVKVKDGCR